MPRDDDFSAPTKRLIAARAGYQCAFPNCFTPTSGPALDEQRAVNIGEAAHITAAQPNGPRYDSSLTPDERSDADNGIWMCSTHATLIDRDVTQYSTELLREWKWQSEDRARKMLGQPKGCASGKIAAVTPATRLGAETNVLVGDESVPFTGIFNVDAEHGRLTWFVSAMVIQFSVVKHHTLINATLDHLVVTVHESKAIPPYRMLFGVYPATASLYYVEIDKNSGHLPREFRPTRYFHRISDDSSTEEERFPAPLVLDDNIPATVALRFNAAQSGMYLVSVNAVVSSGADQESLPVMPPQWMIFEKHEEPSEDTA